MSDASTAPVTPADEGAAGAAQPVDSAASSENRPAGGSQTYTKAEMDAAVDKAVKARIDKQSAKHAQELSAKEDELARVAEQVSVLQGRVDAYEAAEARAKAVQAAAASTGVPAEQVALLSGSTEEELTEAAKALMAAAPATSRYPVVAEGANGGKAVTKEDILAIKDKGEV